MFKVRQLVNGKARAIWFGSLYHHSGVRLRGIPAFLYVSSYMTLGAQFNHCLSLDLFICTMWILIMSILLGCHEIIHTHNG